MRQLKREVKIGNVTIGGNHPIAVQTMLNVPVEDIAGNVLHRHIQHGLHRNGMVAANGHIADLHFSFQLPHPVVPLSVIQLR